MNAASYAQPLSPASIVSIFGANLARTQAAAPGAPLPFDLEGTSVTVDGLKAPLFFVSPTQINLQLPSALQTTSTGYVSATIIVTSPSGASPPVQVPLYPTSPALFTADSSGCGHVAAFNVAADGSTSLNTPANSASPSQYISLYGAGFGPALHKPGDGVAAADPAPLQTAAGITIDGEPANIAYAGLAPALVGVDQINVQVPQNARPACDVPVAIEAGGLVSPVTTISIHGGGGHCIDPPVQSYGELLLSKTITLGAAGTQELDALTAWFPSGPGVQQVAQDIPPAGSYVANAETPLRVSRSCAIPGRTNLSAATIRVQASGTGDTVIVTPRDQNGNIIYQQTLPAGYVAPGEYSINAAGGPVNFAGAVAVGRPIQLQTALAPGTRISSTRPFTVTWKGGEPGSLIKVTISSQRGMNKVSDYAYADAALGSLTFQPICSGTVCSLGIPISNSAEVTVEITPSAGTPLPAKGVTGGIKAIWAYRYVFSDIILED